jgi:hypothetical protein
MVGYGGFWWCPGMLHPTSKPDILVAIADKYGKKAVKLPTATQKRKPALVFAFWHWGCCPLTVRLQQAISEQG